MKVNIVVGIGVDQRERIVEVAQIPRRNEVVRVPSARDPGGLSVHLLVTEVHHLANAVAGAVAVVFCREV